MDNELIKKIKHDISEFHPEKFKLKLVDVGQILEEAERKRFDFDRHNGDADDLLVSCMCYKMNIKTNWCENVRACPDDEAPFFIFLILVRLKDILLIYGDSHILITWKGGK